MRFPLFDQAGKLVLTLRDEEAQALYSAKLAAPRGKKQIRALVLTCQRRVAIGFLRGKRSMSSPKTYYVEHVGDDRSRLYQHDHERCNGFADTLMDCVTV